MEYFLLYWYLSKGSDVFFLYQVNTLMKNLLQLMLDWLKMHFLECLGFDYLAGQKETCLTLVLQ